MKFVYDGLKGLLDLNSKDVLLVEGNNLFGFYYGLESTPKLTGVGERFSKINLPRKEIQFSLLVKNEIENNLVNIQEHFFADINNKTPGRLYLNESYVECYITESSKKNPQKYTNVEEVTFTASVLTPLWITESRYDFSIHSVDEKKRGFKLPMRFPMAFVSVAKKDVIDNQRSSDTLAEITFFGPVKNPEILIDDVRYSVEGELLANERYVIDQRNKTVEKITAVGDVINAFKLRQKSPSVFNPFPQGKHIVGYDGTFSVRIILFEGSVEPSWS